MKSFIKNRKIKNRKIFSYLVFENGFCCKYSTKMMLTIYSSILLQAAFHWFIDLSDFFIHDQSFTDKHARQVKVVDESDVTEGSD